MEDFRSINDLATWRMQASGVHNISPQWDGEVEAAGLDCARLVLVAIQDAMDKAADKEGATDEDVVKAAFAKINDLYDAPIRGYKFYVGGPTRFPYIENWAKGPINYFEVEDYDIRMNTLTLKAHMDSPIFKGVEEITISMDDYNRAVRQGVLGRYYDEESEGKEYRYDGRRI